jgi:hypothetical protein
MQISQLVRTLYVEAVIVTVNLFGRADNCDEDVDADS